MRRLLPALILIAALAAGSASLPTAASAPERHLVLLSLDGLRPEFYLDPASPAAELRTLAKAGSAARAAEPVFPTVTYPNHATIVTGVRPARHGIHFNVILEPSGNPGRWYEEAADLTAPTLWQWAQAAGRRTAAVSWPSTLNSPIDLVVPERDYYARPDPLVLLHQATTPGLFERLGVTPEVEIFKEVVRWDAFLTQTATAIIREARPHLLLLHLVQLDHFQHRGGRETAELRPALARIDAHVASIRAALVKAGLGGRTAIIVTGDHGFQDYRRLVFPNDVLARAGLGGCPWTNPDWRATAHITGGSAGVFVNPAGNAAIAARAQAALQREARARYTVVSRRELDELGAMPGAALALEAALGFAFEGTCGPRDRAETGGTHGFLPGRSSMATGFIVWGAGVRVGQVLDRVRLIDVAPTAARLLGVPAPPVEGRVLEEVLQ